MQRQLHMYQNLKEFNEMKIDIYEKDVNNAFYHTLLEEKEALEKQMNLAKKDTKFLTAKVIGGDNISSLR